MAKKRSPQPKVQQNQPVKSHSSQPELINHLNRIINLQDRLNETSLKPDAFIHIALEQVHNLTHASGAAVQLLEDDNLVYHAAKGSLSKFIGKKKDKNNGISGLCISTHQILRSDDIEHDSRIDAEEGKDMQAKSLLIAPIFHDAHVAGVIMIVSTHKNAFSDIDIQTLHIIAGLIGSAITHEMMEENLKKITQEKSHLSDDLRKSEKKLKYTSRHDYLTGLPNRNFFNDQLILTMAKAKRKKQLIALMYLDIDQFKDVNDTLGHTFGDKLLYAFANRLKQCLRASDIAARFGGDEFILLIDDIKETQDAIVIANKVLQSMRQPFTLNNKTLNITTSIGIAFLKDSDIIPDDFIRQADQALYVSKNSGRNTFYIFDNELAVERTPSSN